MKNTKKISMILVGHGYWGKNLLRNMALNPEIEVVGIVDSNQVALDRAKAIYPFFNTFQSLDTAFNSVKAEAVVIATPPESHCSVALQSLDNDCHVLIEKPMALSVDECDKVLAKSRKKNKVLMVDHTFVYNPAVTHLGKRIHNGELGDLLYYDSIRVNLGGFQKTNVLWDLAPHDLSIIDYFTEGKCPTHVSAFGVKHFDSKVETMCYVNFTYADNFVAHLHLNWAAPTKVRQIMLGGTQKMAIYDDNVTTEKIKIYDKGVQIDYKNEDDFRINYRLGNMLAPVIPQTESLSIMLSDFCHSINHDTLPICDGEFGRRVVLILDAISESLKNNGQPIPIESPTLTKPLAA